MFITENSFALLYGLGRIYVLVAYDGQGYR